MTQRSLLEELRDALRGLKEQKISIVEIVRLERFLDTWEDGASVGPDQAALEHERAVALEQMKLQWSFREQADAQMFTSVIEAGQSALKASTIINGGAAAAVLAFIGGLLKVNESTGPAMASVAPMGVAWFMFMIGLGCAGVATGLRYLSQFAYAAALRVHLRTLKPSKFDTVGTFFNWASIVVAAGSFILFFVGSYLLAKLFLSV